MASRNQSDATSFAKKILIIESELAKATGVYAATLFTYTEESAAQGNAEKALYADHQAKHEAYFKLAQTGLSGLRRHEGHIEVQPGRHWHWPWPWHRP